MTLFCYPKSSNFQFSAFHSASVLQMMTEILGCMLAAAAADFAAVAADFAAAAADFAAVVSVVAVVLVESAAVVVVAGVVHDFVHCLADTAVVCQQCFEQH